MAAPRDEKKTIPFRLVFFEFFVAPPNGYVTPLEYSRDEIGVRFISFYCRSERLVFKCGVNALQIF